MERKKRSFFERLTGSIVMQDDREDDKVELLKKETQNGRQNNKHWIEEENEEEAELAVDVYQTSGSVVIQTMVAGVKPDDLELTISRDTATIHGKREDHRNVDDEDYFAKELYWGGFSRIISLPAEIEPEEIEATEKHGLLTIKMQKVDKNKKNTVKIRSI